ncbi:hypothetical protein DL96DRAFT_1708457 [Flagelloscypha sp. PMI_526]|nr:hypothetical protein DL96DRAFT_1708457 [Flagelloscypha sp. PMI_526]
MPIPSLAKSAIRVTKNSLNSYSNTQSKVRSATSNDPLVPSSTLLNEIAELTYNQQHFLEFIEILDKRLNDKGKNWRHVLKSLTLLHHCLLQGSEYVVIYFRENMHLITTLREFQYFSEAGKDLGCTIRIKALSIAKLLSDDDYLRSERRSRSQMREQFNELPDMRASQSDTPRLTESEERELRLALHGITPRQLPKLSDDTENPPEFQIPQAVDPVLGVQPETQATNFSDQGMSGEPRIPTLTIEVPQRLPLLRADYDSIKKLEPEAISPDLIRQPSVYQPHPALQQEQFRSTTQFQYLQPWANMQPQLESDVPHFGSNNPFAQLAALSRGSSPIPTPSSTPMTATFPIFHSPTPSPMSSTFPFHSTLCPSPYPSPVPSPVTPTFNIHEQRMIEPSIVSPGPTMTSFSFISSPETQTSTWPPSQAGLPSVSVYPVQEKGW